MRLEVGHFNKMEELFKDKDNINYGKEEKVAQNGDMGQIGLSKDNMLYIERKCPFCSQLLKLKVYRGITKFKCFHCGKIIVCDIPPIETKPKEINPFVYGYIAGKKK